MAFKKILIIEDNPKHLEEVKKFIDERVNAGADFETHFASTFEETKKALDAEQYDGIISDIFFPDKEGMPPEPPKSGSLDWVNDVGGVKLVREAHARRIPFFLCTSTYHHGDKTQPVTTWLQKNKADFYVDEQDVGSGEAEHKDWQRAFIALAYLRSLLDHKLVEINEEGVVVPANRLEELREKNPDQYSKIKPLLDETGWSSPQDYPKMQAAGRVRLGMETGMLRTLDPILREILDGPGKGLVPHSSEAETTQEMLERAAKEPDVALYDLRVPEYGKVRGQSGVLEPATPERWEAIARPAAEKFVEAWKDNKSKVEQAWGEWLKLSKEGIEGTEAELPRVKPR